MDETNGGNWLLDVLWCLWVADEMAALKVLLAVR